jgi:hypothetical protein
VAGPFDIKPRRVRTPVDEGGVGLLSGATVENIGRSAVIGGPIPIPPPATPGQFRFQQDEILIDAKASDDRAQMVTVALGIQAAFPIPAVPNIFPAGSDPSAFALVEWGVGGFQTFAEIDFIQGVMFAIQCSYLRVKAVYEGFPIGSPFGAATPLRVGAFVGYEPHASVIPTQRTRRFGGPVPIAAGGVVNIPVPPYAGNVEVFRATAVAPFVGGPFTLQFFDFSSTATPRYSIAVAAADDSSGEIEIANDIRLVRLVNGGVILSNVRAIFELML